MERYCRESKRLQLVKGLKKETECDTNRRNWKARKGLSNGGVKISPFQRNKLKLTQFSSVNERVYTIIRIFEVFQDAIGKGLQY